MVASKQELNLFKINAIVRLNLRTYCPVFEVSSWTWIAEIVFVEGYEKYFHNLLTLQFVSFRRSASVSVDP